MSASDLPGEPSRFARRGPLYIGVGIVVVLLLTALFVVPTITKAARNAVEDELDQLRARGEPVQLSELIQPEVPDERNGAALLTELHRRGGIPDVEGLFELLEAEDPASSPLLETVREQLPELADEIALLEEASARPEWRPPDITRAGTLLVSVYIDSVRLLAGLALLESIDGDAFAALERLQQAIAITSALEGQRPIIEFLAWAFCVEMTLDVADIVFSNAPEELDTSGVRDYFRPERVRPGVAAAMTAERAWTINVFSSGGLDSGWLGYEPFLSWGLLEYLEAAETAIAIARSDAPGTLLTCPGREELLAEAGWYAEGILMFQLDWRSLCETAHELEVELTRARARWK